jgi:signal transduction histidine kinase
MALTLSSESPAPTLPPAPAARWPAWAPPRPVVLGYLLAWLPLGLVYLVATETDGSLFGRFDLLAALRGTARNLGPAVLLLALAWPFTGWLERRGCGLVRTVALHFAVAAIFAWAWQGLSFLLIWAFWGLRSAELAWQRWMVWQAMWGMMMYWAVAGGFTAWRAVQRAREQAGAAAQAQALLLRTELAALRNKLNPHFLFNTLHSIVALVRKDAARAEGALLMFSDMLRYVLETEKSGREQVPLAEELDFTRDYLALEALRLGPRLSVDWQLDDAALGHAVPALSVQPLAENSILHAFNPRVEAGRLTISVRLAADGRRLAIRIADDGPGAEPERWRRGQGLGLRTVERRLALMFGTAARMDVRTAPGEGFAVEIELPVEGAPA